ncbi:MAG: SPASM domain-containing protein, partial [bacterium]|nr:SPASM domain-containing protein [bacterium]
AGNCSQYFVVEHNGDIYPCDFFVDADKRLGNIFDDSWETLQASAAYRDFGKLKAQWNDVCRSCPYLRYCSGDCLKHRPGCLADSAAVSVLCPGWKCFFHHAASGLEDIARRIIKERSSNGITAPAGTLCLTGHPGRNDLCPCGSGRKYKKCHGAA